MKTMKTQPTIAHGFKTHTIACVFHDFEGFREMTEIEEKTSLVKTRPIHSRWQVRGYLCTVYESGLLARLGKNDILFDQFQASY